MPVVVYTKCQPPRTRVLSSAERERWFPYCAAIILRTAWHVNEQLRFNDVVSRFETEHRQSEFNGILCVHYRCLKPAQEMADWIAQNRMDRLKRNCTDGATREEVAAEWVKIAQEREVILAWGRRTAMLREVVQQYRFERKQGTYSYLAHAAAAKIVEKADPTVADPLNYAGVLIEWVERQNRDWFWRCCRDHHTL